MSIADELYRKTCIDILENGFYDTDLEVRPRWADGTPAHTVKSDFCHNINGVCCNKKYTFKSTINNGSYDGFEYFIIAI